MRRRRQKVALIDRIREVAGDEAATALVKAFGGRKLYVPLTTNEDHAISRKIGIEASAALSRRFGGDYIDVPIKWIRLDLILALAAKHVPQSEIARRVGCSRRKVSQVLSPGE
jgi:DNA-binding transcriptional regulator LsrR (DeoR family)